ncbi:hypothetical protein Daus18300_002174 [Diaporthe australafricana]|uniref:Xylanolytic transcriptional activator regulatory domain-containing protein n=1 Tax=Diaporthe australafricana TaxID=127596 RepID=A0ABR3XQI8_9PEZI
MYEFKHLDFRQGWLTAGYAFRLIQLGWFQEIISGMDLLPDSMDWTELEEKRRTFWLAFYLDRIISLRTDSPCSFGEENLIPLPVPDANFQNGIPTITGYLADVLDNIDHASDGPSSDFAESIILASVCGYALSHRRQLFMEQSQCSGMDAFWNRYRQINAMVTERADLSATRRSMQAAETEPTLLFQRIMWRTIILYMYQTLDFAVALADKKHPALEYYREASIAAQHLVSLTDRLLRVDCSKLHPLSLIPLNMCSKLLETWPELAMSFSNHFQIMSEAMRGFVNV